MRALLLDYSERKLVERDTVAPGAPAAHEARFRVRETGICGTDRTLARFSIGRPPAGESKLILGHEALGEVEAVGSGVSGFAPGDLVVPMVRRPCGECSCCGRGRWDLCLTGRYVERGIVGAHGYFCDVAIDEARFLVPVPAALADLAVLVEPMSVVEKAVEAGLGAHEDTPRTAIVLGAGPIGLLAALVLQSRGLAVTLVSLESETNPRAALARQAGIEYRRQASGPADLVIEAAGAPEAGFQAVRLLAPCGVAVILGAMDGTGTFPFHGLILGNRKVIGAVNAPRESFEAAVTDLQRLDRRVLSQLIERRSRREVFESLGPNPPQAVKLVHVLDA